MAFVVAKRTAKQWYRLRPVFRSLECWYRLVRVSSHGAHRRLLKAGSFCSDLELGLVGYFSLRWCFPYLSFTSFDLLLCLVCLVVRSIRTWERPAAAVVKLGGREIVPTSPVLCCSPCAWALMQLWLLSSAITVRQLPSRRTLPLGGQKNGICVIRPRRTAVNLRA